MPSDDVKNRFWLVFNNGSLFLFTLIALITAVGSEANARPFDYFKFTCAPEVGYFALHTIALESKPSSIVIPNPNKNVLKQNNLSTAHDLVDHPYHCNLPGRNISVEITDFRPGHERGECASIDDYRLAVKINGEKVDDFSAFGGNRCLNPERHLIEVDAFTLTDCTLPQMKNDAASCQWMALPKSAKRDGWH